LGAPEAVPLRDVEAALAAPAALDAALKVFGYPLKGVDLPEYLQLEARVRELETLAAPLRRRMAPILALHDELSGDLAALDLKHGFLTYPKDVRPWQQTQLLLDGQPSGWVSRKRPGEQPLRPLPTDWRDCSKAGSIERMRDQIKTRQLEGQRHEREAERRNDDYLRSQGYEYGFGGWQKSSR
jgi:hypothetical protein